MRSRTAWTSSGVMSVTSWSAAAWPATWAKIPSSSAAEKRAPQPGITSPQAKVFMRDSLSWGAATGRGVRRGPGGLAGLRRGGGEVLDPQQADDVAVRIGAEHRVEAMGGNAGERALQRIGDARRRVHAQR